MNLLESKFVNTGSFPRGIGGLYVNPIHIEYLFNTITKVIYKSNTRKEYKNVRKMKQKQETKRKHNHHFVSLMYHPCITTVSPFYHLGTIAQFDCFWKAIHCF